MLLEKWGPMLKAGDAIESDSAKLALAKVFENTYKEFKNHGLLTEAGMSAAPMDGKTVSYGLGDVNIRKGNIRLYSRIIGIGYSFCFTERNRICRIHTPCL